MLKKQLEEDLKKTVDKLGYKSSDVVLSIPPKPFFGDYTSNVALQQANQKNGNFKHSSQVIAKEILSHLSDLNYLNKVEIAGPGFLNFFIKPEEIAEQIKEILSEGENFGKSHKGVGQKVQVEFVSANPTGPLTLANGRGGALGDTLANLLRWVGYDVEREYYVNDTGNQVRLLGESVLAAAGKAEPKGEHYQGEYIKDLAQKFKDKLGLNSQDLGHLLADHLLESEIKPALKRLGVKFDEFYSERSLHQRSLVKKTAQFLKDKGVAYEKDGALWLKTEQYGDEKDRVLVTSEEKRGKNEPTYFLPDIAFHFEIFSEGFDKKINIWGADHHGYVSRLKAAMEAAGFGNRVDIILMQMVRLFKGGQEVRMSKRAGTFITLNELLDLVGKDVARFFFLMYSPDSPIDFNLDLAQEQSNKNPVFYVQYAHARMANIINRAKEIEDLRQTNFALLKNKEELELIKHLAFFPELVTEISQTYQVHKLTAYSLTLADFFHKFYETSRVIGAETRELESARLALVRAAKITLASTLNLMGVEAPERM